MKQMQEFVESLEAMSVSTARYQARMDGGVYSTIQELPVQCRAWLESGGDAVARDYLGLFQRGKQWIAEPLEGLQPYSYQAFQKCAGPLLLGIVLIKDLMNPEGPPLIAPVTFFDASGRLIEVFPTFPDSTYENGHDSAYGSLRSLPAALARSWLWRTDGWRMPSEPFQGPLFNRRLVCHPKKGWEPIDDVLKTFDKKRWQWSMNSILKQFPDAVLTLHNPHDGSPYQRTSMRCFLDTRPPDVNGPVGDQFFVLEHKHDQTVYHIHRGDVENIRILRDPADAIDRYCAHVLRRTPGEFDFSPWSEVAT